MVVFDSYFRYAGLIHGGHLTFPEAAISKKFMKDHYKGLEWLLSGGK